MQSVKSNYIKKFLEPGNYYRDPRSRIVYHVDFIKGKGNYATKITEVPDSVEVINLQENDIPEKYLKRKKDKNRLHLRWKAQKECLDEYIKRFGDETLLKIEEKYGFKITKK